MTTRVQHKVGICVKCSALKKLQAKQLCNKCYYEQPEQKARLKAHNKKPETKALIRIAKAKPSRIATHKATVRAYRLKAIAYLTAAKNKPCMDCGLSFPTICMDFDHRPSTSKKLDVSVMVGSGWSIALIQAEIDKCDLVCSNCHRIRTHKRLIEQGESDGGC